MAKKTSKDKAKVSWEDILKASVTGNPKPKVKPKNSTKK
jgi:hypothetical protein